MSIKPGTNYTVTRKGIGGLESVTKDPFSPTQIGRTHISAQTFTVPTADIHNDDYSIQGGHGLSTGDALIYNSMGGAPITSSTALMNPQTTDLNNNTIHDPNSPHTLETGDIVVYSNGGGTTLAGLGNDTQYYAIKVDATTIKLALTYDNAILGTAVTLTGTGNNSQKIQNCLQDNQTYYISKKTADQFFLHKTYASAIADVSGDGTGRIELDNTLKGNNSQVFSTSFGRLQ